MTAFQHRFAVAEHLQPLAEETLAGVVQRAAATMAGATTDELAGDALIILSADMADDLEFESTSVEATSVPALFVERADDEQWSEEPVAIALTPKPYGFAVLSTRGDNGSYPRTALMLGRAVALLLDARSLDDTVPASGSVGLQAGHHLR